MIGRDLKEEYGQTEIYTAVDGQTDRDTQTDTQQDGYIDRQVKTHIQTERQTHAHTNRGGDLVPVWFFRVLK